MGRHESVHLLIRKRVLVFANILHTYLKAVTSPFLEIQTFYYNNYSVLVGFFLIPGHRYSCGLYRLLQLRHHLQFISLHFSIQKIWKLKKTQGKSSFKILHLLMPAKQIPDRESRCLRKPCSPW